MEGRRIRLGDVIDDEALLEEPSHQFYGRRQLLRINENVVGETECAQLRDAFDEVFPREKPIIRLSLRDMAKAAQFRRVRKMLEPFPDTRR